MATREGFWIGGDRSSCSIKTIQTAKAAAMNTVEPTRADLATAWAEGKAAAAKGSPRTANPYIGVHAALAKNWDQGWQDG